MKNKGDVSQPDHTFEPQDNPKQTRPNLSREVRWRFAPLHLKRKIRQLQAKREGLDEVGSKPKSSIKVRWSEP